MNGKFSNVKKVLAMLVCTFMVVQCAALCVFAYDIDSEAEVFVRPEVVLITANQIGKNYIYVDVVTENSNNDQPIVAYLVADGGRLVTVGYSPIGSNSAQIKLGVPDSAPTDDYTIVVALNRAEDVALSSVYYVGVEDVDGFFEAVNLTDVEQVKAKLDNHYEAFSVVESTKDVKLEGNDYQELSENGKMEFATLIANGVNGKYSDGKGGYNAENAEDFVKEAYVVAAYNEGGFTNKELAEIIYNYSNTIGFDAEDTNLYAKIQNKDTLVKVTKTMTSTVLKAEEIASTLEQAVCVQIVNETHWLNLVNVVADNNNLFGVRQSQIDKLKSKKSLREAFCKKFKGTYYSVDEIRDAWTEAYEEAVKESSSETGGGGGGGGTTTTKDTVITNTVSTQITDSQNNYDPNVEILDYYNDVAGTSYSWTSEAVLNLTKAGIVSGYGDKMFAPGNSLTRAEFTKMVVNTFGLADITATCSFTDVDPNAWYYIYIASAEKYNLAQGYGNGLFGVNDPITRQDAITLIYRAAQAKGISTEHFRKSAADLLDKNDIDAYAYPAVEALYNTGVYLDSTNPASVNTFEPKRYATRGYVSVILYRLYTYMN